MHFSNLFASLLATALTAVVSASPVASNRSDWKYAHGWDGKVIEVGTAVNSTGIKKRTPGGVFICDELNWSGRCGYALGSDWHDQISSFGPDQGAICYAYPFHSADQCSSAGSVWSFQYPGDASGGWSTSNPWDDKAGSLSIASFKCEATGGGGGSFTGRATYYTPDGGFGACGAPLQNSDFIVALSEAHYDGGSHCWQHLNVEYNGQNIDVTVGDLCPGCSTDGIDLSIGAFSALADTDLGVIEVTWSFK
ncbi:RlpA-like double-psi beta-barrel-protein domain-containing protein-containing protein [Mycena sp. CBHHK59/15]|nr:RlpA-like double-psi beta-barrel-protein domain-containing protein-containing protein [Mycena sp. CBHHK59/15]